MRFFFYPHDPPQYYLSGAPETYAFSRSNKTTVVPSFSSFTFVPPLQFPRSLVYTSPLPLPHGFSSGYPAFYPLPRYPIPNSPADRFHSVTVAQRFPHLLRHQFLPALNAFPVFAYTLVPAPPGEQIPPSIPFCTSSPYFFPV